MKLYYCRFDYGNTILEVIANSESVGLDKLKEKWKWVGKLAKTNSSIHWCSGLRLTKNLIHVREFVLNEPTFKD